MTAIQNYENRLSRALQMKRPLIHIETSDYDWEYNTVCRLLESSAGVSFINRFRWTPNMHYQTDEGQEIPLCSNTGIGEVIELLDNFTGIEEPDLLLVFDIAHYLDGDTEPGINACTARSQIISRFYSFFSKQENKQLNDRSTIVVLCPKFYIPPELQNRIYRLTPPYPDDQDIEHELGLDTNIETISRSLINEREFKHTSPTNNTIEYKYSPSFFANDDGILLNTDGEVINMGYPAYIDEIDGKFFEINKKRLISAFKGMRLRSIQILLSYCDNPYNISGTNLKSLGESKERMVRDSGLLKLEHVEDGYQNFVGDIDGLKRYLEEDKTIISNREIYSKMGRLPTPKGLLLVGPPGCGKSETSKAIADILGITLLSLDMGKLSSKWVGESEHNFENAIALAEAAQPCVLRIDELDKAFANTGEESGDQSGMKILGFFLTWMQERNSMVYLVATANDLSKLRPEFLRKGRWDEIFYLSYPSSDGMAKIIISTLNRYNLEIENNGSTDRDTTNETIHKICENIFDRYRKAKISGAIIADSIEKIYRKSFLKDPTKEVSSININDIYDILLKHAQKTDDPEIEKKIKEDIRMFRLEYLRTHQPLTDEQKESIRTKVSKKYSKANQQRIREVEARRSYVDWQLKQDKDGKNSSDKNIKSKMEEILTKEYDENYFSKIIDNETQDILLTHSLNNDLEISEQTIAKMEDLLRAKYENDMDIESFYQSKGYISASIGFK